MQGYEVVLEVTLELLADNIEAHKKIAKWYFDEWVSLVSDVSVEQVEVKLAEAVNRCSPPLMVLAKDAKRIIGAAELKTREMGIFPDYEFWIGGIYVDSEYRGKGIAKCLVSDIVKRAKVIGIHTLYLQTEDLTGGLYVGFGFKPIKVIEHKGYEVLVMVVDLNA